MTAAPTMPTADNPLVATAWVVASGFMFAAMAVTVRYLEGRVPSTDLSFYRAIVVVLIYVFPLVLRDARGVRALLPRRGMMWTYFSRGAVVFLAQAAYYHALSYIPLAEATVLNACGPIFAAMLAVLILRERVGLGRWLLIALGFAGVAIIIRPGFEAVPIEALLALGSAVLFAMSWVLNKQLAGVESGPAILYGTNLFVAVIGSAVVVFWGVIPTWHDLGIIVAIGACGAGAQYCVTTALAHGDVSFVTPFEFLRVPITAILAYVLFREVPTFWFIPGSVLIFLSVYLLARSSARARARRSAS